MSFTETMTNKLYLDGIPQEWEEPSTLVSESSLSLVLLSKQMRLNLYNNYMQNSSIGIYSVSEMSLALISCQSTPDQSTGL